MNEQVIWDYLYNKVQNPYGVAALMGNLYVESKLNPKNLQGSYERKLGMTDDQYTEAVDNGTYTSVDFINDGAGYGLVQWTYWSRKEGLLNLAKSRGVSIGNLRMQLDYLWSEIQKYKTVIDAMKTGNSVRAISDVIAKRYERPADQSDKALQNRANYGQSFFDKFAKVNESKAEVKESKLESTGRVIRAKVNVNIRTGNGKAYPKLGALKAGQSVPWIASSQDGWHAFKYNNAVCWVSGEFAEVIG